ncbi:MAG: NGG1p interacting factor NIF3, partial [Planctomycetes bacterium]|nr:NGG1p interacting factor NIF3 [Planctomycetota bacterium]
MTTKQIYELAIKLGINSDLRGQEKAKNYLNKAKKKYEKLDKNAKEEFDLESLSNPYSDTRILVDLQKKNIKKIL